MHKGRIWLVLCALLVIVGGQITYACETMDMPAQPVCCCEDGMAGCDTAATVEEDCHHSQPAASCCSMEYSSPAAEAVTASLVPEQLLSSLYPVAPIHWPSIEVFLLPGYSRSDPADSSWLLARAISGRAAYLSTLRLRI